HVDRPKRAPRAPRREARPRGLRLPRAPARGDGRGAGADLHRPPPGRAARRGPRTRPPAPRDQRRGGRGDPRLRALGPQLLPRRLAAAEDRPPDRAAPGAGRQELPARAVPGGPLGPPPAPPGVRSARRPRPLPRALPPEGAVGERI